MTHLLTPETLFLSTLADLERRTRSSDPYEVLGIAGLIRKLLLDDHPLVDQVNRRHRIKLRFNAPATRTVEELRQERVSYYDALDTFDPGFQAVFPDTAKPASRDSFLGTLVMWAWDTPITVRDIVTFEANVAGGVHAPNAPTQVPHVRLDAVRQQLVVKDQGVSLYHLRNIGKLVLQGLAPLRERLEDASGGA